MFLNNSARTAKTILALMSVVTILILTINLGILSRTAVAAGGTMATVKLLHSPTGNAQLSYNPNTKTLTVTTSLVGLAPNSTHPTHIHQGGCTSSEANIKYPLQNVVANAVGQGTATTVIPNVAGGIPATGWYLIVHNGPNLQPAAQDTAIACASIQNPRALTTVNTPLGASASGNENATGTAHLQVNNNTLTVTLNVSGLAPNTQHAAHIHAGNCQATMQVLYDLSPLQSDSAGNASKTMTFKGVSAIPSTGWDINVHYTNNLSTQTGYNPILCGNVVPS
ncbi:CHRD domain-containing protein [Dictyobacter kobayashii]|uniref:CHRD domain-containing protein n=1 Tax=Dictyobacter kobayashii TaxID=2014872 RepID=A0A402AU31_9CHLR|nr:CHRD domain-containing protein [Dictyobacter kobayashii]GCE22622.1 hypothetical protein KDK_64220 [Dictyobacter kobayashii]